MEFAGALLITWSSFKNHVILVQLRVHGADLPLSIRVIKSAVDGGGRNAEPRCADAIDDQRYRQPPGLLVRRHIGKLRQLLHLVDKPASPQIQLVRVGVFQRVLILGAAHPVVHGNILHRLHVELDSLDRLEARLQPADHVRGAQFTHADRLQVDGHSSAVQSGIGSIRADKGRQTLNCGVLKNDGCQLLLLLLHGRKGNRRRRLRDALNLACILYRKESFGDHDVEHNRQHQRGRGHQQRDGLIAQHELQRAAVKRDHVLEYTLGCFVETALLFLGSVAQNACAHHGRQRERDDGREDDGDGQGDREFAKEAADNIAHEEQRNQHRDQRDRKRNNRKADLLSALHGRLHGRVPGLEIAGNVLDHHDRVIHHKPRGDGERHQRKIVQTITQRIHGAEGSHQ